jgi:hypothetical protein
MLNIFVGAHSLNSIPNRFRHRIGNLFSPGGYWNNNIQFALDNYVYAAWKRKEEWDGNKFIAHLDKVRVSGKSPLWVVCPDAIGDAQRSRQLWEEWSPKLRGYNWPLAFAVQDGATKATIPTDADVIFVGGTTGWKQRSVEYWCQNFPRVHVGRINTYRWLWHCHKYGAESIDGTGWFWKNKREHQDLLDYLAITEGEIDRESGTLFALYPYSQPLKI